MAGLFTHAWIANLVLQKLSGRGVISSYENIDDYFQGEAGWLFPYEAAGNILRANDLSILRKLGVSQKDIAAFKVLSAGYIREPGIDALSTFGLVPNLDEGLFRQFASQTPLPESFLKDFKKISIEKCPESLEAFL